MADTSTGRTTLIVTLVAIVCLALALIIGLTLHFTIYREPEPVERSAAVGNCIPEPGASVDRHTCLQRG